MSALARLPRSGTSEAYFCRPERSTTTFYWAGSENHDKPRVDYWRCTHSSCGYVRIAYAQGHVGHVGDADGFVRTVVNKSLRGSGTIEYGDERSLDYDDLIDEGRELLWQLYTKWQPAQTPSFSSYASYFLPLRLVRWWRRRFGSDGNKPLGNAASLDAPHVGVSGSSEDEFFAGNPATYDHRRGGAGEPVGSWSGDGDEGSGLVLSGLFARADRRALRLAAGGVRRPVEDVES